MKMEIESTQKIVLINNVSHRIWEGYSENGIKVICFITRVAVAEGQDEEVYDIFKKELESCKAPSKEAESFPLRMII